MSFNVCENCLNDDLERDKKGEIIKWVDMNSDEGGIEYYCNHCESFTKLKEKL